MLFNGFRKGQMEVLGLTVVVILMAVAMLFVVGKMINRPVSDTKQSYLDQEVAANMLNSLLKTSAGDDCSGADFTELFQDCAVNKDLGGTIVCKPDNRLSCAYLEDVINNTILRNTTVRWKIPHRLSATLEGQDEPVLDFEFLNCSSSEIGFKYQHMETKLSPIPTSIGTLNVEFNICS